MQIAFIRFPATLLSASPGHVSCPASKMVLSESSLLLARGYTRISVDLESFVASRGRIGRRYGSGPPAPGVIPQQEARWPWSGKSSILGNAVNSVAVPEPIWNRYEGTQRRC